MRVGEFQCNFGSDQAVVKLKFRERISAQEEPGKLQYSLSATYRGTTSGVFRNLERGRPKNILKTFFWDADQPPEIPVRTKFDDLFLVTFPIFPFFPLFFVDLVKKTQPDVTHRTTNHTKGGGRSRTASCIHHAKGGGAVAPPPPPLNTPLGA
jgi:hypothetical protein